MQRASVKLERAVKRIFIRNIREPVYQLQTFPLKILQFRAVRSKILYLDSNEHRKKFAPVILWAMSQFIKVPC